MNVTGEAPSALPCVIVNAVDSDVDNGRAGFHPFGLDHVGSAHGGDDDVGFSAPLRDVLASRVDHSHGRVCPTRGEKKLAYRLSGT